MDSRGNRGDTQGKPCGIAREALVDVAQVATGGYKETKFYWVGKGVGVARSVRWYLKDSTTLGEGRGSAFIVFPKEDGTGDCESC